MVQRGRKRDESRAADLIEVALEVLHEHGYEKMTLAMVAKKAKAGKGTMYRRWTSKADLVLDAVTHLGKTQVDLGALPDTGSLRTDLLGLFKPRSVKDIEIKLKILSGVTAMISRQPDFAKAIHAAFVDPWVEVNLILMERARDRGEIRQDADITAVSQIIPVAAAYRGMILNQALDLIFLTGLLDGVVLPAVLKTSRVSESARL